MQIIYPMTIWATLINQIPLLSQSISKFILLFCWLLFCSSCAWAHREHYVAVPRSKHLRSLGEYIFAFLVAFFLMHAYWNTLKREGRLAGCGYSCEWNSWRAFLFGFSKFFLVDWPHFHDYVHSSARGFVSFSCSPIRLKAHQHFPYIF